MFLVDILTNHVLLDWSQVGGLLYGWLIPKNLNKIIIIACY